MATIYPRGNWLHIHYYLQGRLHKEALNIPNTPAGLIEAERFKEELEAKLLLIKRGKMEINRIFPDHNDSNTQFIQSPQSNVISLPNNYTLSEGLNKFFEFKANGLDETSTYGFVMKILIKNICGNILIKDVTKQHGNQLEAYLYKNKRSKNTAVTYLNHLRVVFNYFKNEKWIETIPIPKVKWDDRPIVTLAEADLKKILDFLKKEEEYKLTYYLVRLLLLTGFRISELLNLRKDMIDFEHNVINIRNFKGKRNEVFPLYPELRIFLKEVINNTKHNELFAGLDRFDAYALFQNVLKKLEIKHYKLHDLRRTFASRMASKLTTVELQKVMRHKSIGTTLKSYVNLDMNSIGHKM